MSKKQQNDPMQGIKPKKEKLPLFNVILTVTRANK